jgi:hypothetical protein
MQEIEEGFSLKKVQRESVCGDRVSEKNSDRRPPSYQSQIAIKSFWLLQYQEEQKQL